MSSDLIDNADQTKPQGPINEKVPEGDNRLRRVCDDCGFIDYINPKIVVGAVVTHGDKFLICKRAIEPCVGKWTMPAGYLELDESLEEGSVREVFEESGARVEITGLLGIYDIPHIGQVHVMHHAEMITPDYKAGPESQEVQLVTWDDLPWDDFAFPSVTWAFETFKAQHIPATTVAPRRKL